MLILMCAFQDEVAAARPDIDARTEQLVSKGRWHVPGYKVGDIGVIERLRPWILSIVLTDALGEIWGSLGAIEQNVHLRSSFALRARNTTLYLHQILYDC